MTAYCRTPYVVFIAAAVAAAVAAASVILVVVVAEEKVTLTSLIKAGFFREKKSTRITLLVVSFHLRVVKMSQKAAWRDVTKHKKFIYTGVLL